MTTITRPLITALLVSVAAGITQSAGATAIVGANIDQRLSFDCNPLLSYSPSLSSTSQSSSAGDANRALTVNTQSSSCTGMRGVIGVSGTAGSNGDSGDANGTAEITESLTITNSSAVRVPAQPDGLLMVGATFNQSEPFTFVSGVTGCLGRGNCAPDNLFDFAFLSFTYSVDCSSTQDNCGPIALSFTNTYVNGASDISDTAITVDDHSFLPHETHTYTTRLFLVFEVRHIPEPGTFVLLLAALGLLLVTRPSKAIRR